MRRHELGLIVALTLFSMPGRADDVPLPHVAASTRPLDDFESGPNGWRFVGGEEFPGAKGSMTLDADRPHGGKASLKLDADFRGGGAYVGVWKDLPGGLPDLARIRLWVRSRNVRRLGVRIVDATGQCHQGGVDLPGGADGEWRELTLDVRGLVGGEHWGGANDGAWHGPPKGLGWNVGKDGLADAKEGRASVAADDLVGVPVAAGRPTLVACSNAPTACRPGFGTRITYAWDAEPLGVNCNVFVHFVNAKGQMVFQADHEPPVPTSGWSGPVEYSRSVAVPTDAPPGRYDIVIGFWKGGPAPEGGGRRPFRAGAGLAMLSEDSCRVGSLEVSPDAPLPKLPPPSLDLSNYKLTFDEDFRGPLSVSAWGPGTRWIAHTPYAGDFGDAGFADPQGDFPFSTRDGVLRIEARKVDGKWRSGLLSSVDPKGEGFSQKYGYLEMRAKFPRGPGTWPAFWLMGVPQLKEPRDRKTITQVEIDVVEQYGVGPHALHTTLHLWGPGDFHRAEGDTAIVPGMTDDFHTYGVSVEEDFIRYYFDGVELRKDRTPKEAKVPLYVMVDLALGGGWPIARTPDPSVMLVDYVRAYSRK